MECSIKAVMYQTCRQSNEICYNACVSFESKANNKSLLYNKNDFTDLSLYKFCYNSIASVLI